MKNLLFSLFTVASLLPLASFADPNMDTGKLDNPVSADAAFIPARLLFGTHINDAILQKIGCKYFIDGPDKSFQLLKILLTARDLPQDQLISRKKFEVRNKIIFHFKNSEDVSVEFGQKFLNQPYVNATWNTQPILLRDEVVAEIREVIKGGKFAQINEHASSPCDLL
ncbi:hypothetical protein [Duganella sp. Leaf126]|uniref:hypothetical protein n=1 Tax=Duganella sp. Leaf126 TaxID=1736266 RepID=UPI0012E1E3BC|nr:hypothetical protein [Duganella sp. Leaf126]